MIRQLRKKFIIVAMSSILAVLAVIIVSLNVVNYRNMVSRADRILQMLSENDGHFPKNFPGKEQPPEEPADAMPRQQKTKDLSDNQENFRGLSVETPYDTRFFSVKLDGKGEVVSVDTGRIAAVKTDEAVGYAQTVWDQTSRKSQKTGFLGDYRYISQVAEATGECRVIFVDCSKERDSFRNLMITSLGVSALGMIAVFILVYIFSRRVFLPVEESYRKQKQFVTDASHELKTPLTIISANVDLLEMEGEKNQWTASIRNQVKRLRNLTEQMVTLSRLEEEQAPVFVKCNLSEIVTDTATVFEPLILAEEKQLETEIAADIVCMGEEEKLRQMVSLLLDNALKYSSEKGEIRVKLSAHKNGRVCLTLWNTVGEESGIAPGRQDMLFERFYRTDGSRNSRTGGSGIGLSVVKAIAELHGGKISAKSEDGKSICFTIIL